MAFTGRFSELRSSVRTFVRVGFIASVTLCAGTNAKAIGETVITNSAGVWHQWPVQGGGNGHWYGFIAMKMPPQAFEEIIEQWGGTLACLTEPGEFQFLVTSAQTRDNGGYGWATGLTADPGKLFQWPDGTEISAELLQEYRLPTPTNDFGGWSALAIGGGRSSFVTAFDAANPMAPLIEVTNHPSLLSTAVGVFSEELAYSTEAAKFESYALGDEPLQFQWYVDDAPVPGATGTKYLMQLTTLNTGRVSVVVRSLRGEARSGAREVTIFPTQYAGRVRWSQWPIQSGGNGHWYGYLDPNRYGVVTDGMTWHSAREYAQRYGADLVMPHTAEEWEQLLRLAKDTRSNFPLGLSDEAIEGSFEWTDGAVPEFQHWGRNEPSSGSSNSDFAYVQRVNGTTAWSWATITPETKFLAFWFELTNAPPKEIEPVVLKVPADLQITVGATRRLECDVVAGAGAIFEWRHNDNILKISAEPFVDLRPMSTNDSGAYHLIVRSQFGMATGGPVNLTVVVPTPTNLSTLFEAEFSRFEIHFNYYWDIEYLVLESSEDLTNWVHQSFLSGPAAGTFFNWDTGFSRDTARRFFRVRRFPYAPKPGE